MNATKYTVANWLKKYYGLDDKTATDLVEKHSKIIDDAKLIGSFAYYAADKIAEEEKLIELEIPRDMDIGEDD